MTDTSTPQKTYKKTLDLSPEARALLAQALPLEVEGDQVFIWRKMPMPSYGVRCEIVNFIAGLANEALTTIEQPVPMCADPGCLNAADPTTSGGARCLQHEAERWTAEQILQREG